MILASNTSNKNYGLFTFAIILLLLGGVAIYIGSNDLAIRSVGLVLCIVSVYYVQKSKIHTRADFGNHKTQQVETKRPHLCRSIWIVSLILVPILGLSFFCLYMDAIHGYHQRWPVYLFAATTVCSALCWSYLLSKLL